MSSDTMINYDDIRGEVRRRLDPGDVTREAQAKLDAAYAMLGSIAQDYSSATDDSFRSTYQDTARQQAETQVKATQCVASGKPGGVRVVKRGLVVAIAAAIIVLFGCTAYAVSRLVQVGPNDADFFKGDNLSIYNSMAAGTASLSADVGDSVTVDGTTFTFDTISCDRNIVNLFFTIEKEGDFNLEEYSIYEGSNEDEWMRLQRIIPRFSYVASSNGEEISKGNVNILDAYMEDGKIKCMLRIVPSVSLPDQVDVSLTGWYYDANYSQESAQEMTFSAGLDLSTVVQPKELGAQDIVFHTTQGEKKLSIERFTVSEFGVVFVAKNPTVWLEEGKSTGVPDDAIDPRCLKITDEKGNNLNYVTAGDGMGTDPWATYVLELSGANTAEQSITFTPMLYRQDQANVSPAESAPVVDVSQIGAQLPTSEYGGYELTNWEVQGSKVRITLKPYGWLAFGGMMDLIPDAEEDITLLLSEHTNQETGETFTGAHLGIGYSKRDYMTGDLMQIDSYYAAGEEELKELKLYHYYTMFGWYQEDAAAAVTLDFEE